MSDQRNIENAEASLIWALDKASTSLEVRNAVNEALSFVRCSADEIASLRAKIASYEKSNWAPVKKLQTEVERLRNQLVNAREALKKVKHVVLTNRTHSYLDEVKGICDEALALTDDQGATK